LQIRQKSFVKGELNRVDPGSQRGRWIAVVVGPTARAL